MVPRVDVELGDNGQNNHYAFNAIDEQGGEVFFTTCIDNVVTLIISCLCVWVVGDARSVQAAGGSRKGAVEEVPCEGPSMRASAKFVGASEDGSRVFFTTGRR